MSEINYIILKVMGSGCPKKGGLFLDPDGNIQTAWRDFKNEETSLLVRLSDETAKELVGHDSFPSEPTEDPREESKWTDEQKAWIHNHIYKWGFRWDKNAPIGFEDYVIVAREHARILIKAGLL